MARSYSFPVSPKAAAKDTVERRVSVRVGEVVYCHGDVEPPAWVDVMRSGLEITDS